MKLRIGTRGSQLALKQTEMVVDVLQEKYNELEIEVEILQSKGDKIQNVSLQDAGGKGLFIETFEQALLDGRIDCAVHSGKDLPSDTPSPFCIPAVLKRGSCCDVLISKKEITDTEGLIIGTSSPRREALSKKFFPGCDIKLLRGNVLTRLHKLETEEYDAILLAKAGLERLNVDLSNYYVKELDIHQFIPASCQGILAIECLENSDFKSILESINDKSTKQAFDMERRMMNLLHADCHDPTAVHLEKGCMDVFYKDKFVLQREIHDDRELEDVAKELL